MQAAPLPPTGVDMDSPEKDVFPMGGFAGRHGTTSA